MYVKTYVTSWGITLNVSIQKTPQKQYHLLYHMHHRLISMMTIGCSNNNKVNFCVLVHIHCTSLEYIYVYTGFTRWLNHILVPVDEYGHVMPCRKGAGNILSCIYYAHNIYMYIYSFFLVYVVVHTGSMSLERVDFTLPPQPQSSLPLSGHRRWCRLRRAACLLYQSEPLTIVHARLEVSSIQRTCTRCTMHIVIMDAHHYTYNCSVSAY